jgi:protein O-mannosyl-transferase
VRDRLLITRPSARAVHIGVVALLLAITVFAAFLPALDNGFVNWDDDKNFLGNPFYRGLGWAQAKWAWTTFWVGVYQPLAWLLYEVQFSFSRLDPRGYHLVSAVLHAANAVVLYVLTLTLLLRCQPEACRRSPGSCQLAAGFAACLFAVHPLRVEAVAWASCQPYLPCASFSMLAVLAYLRAFGAGSGPRMGWVAGAFVLFIAALLSHAVAVSLPAVLLILDVYPLRRFGEGSRRWFGPAARRVGYEKIPFVIAGLAFMGLAVAARRHALAAVERNDLSASVAHAGYGIWFYAYKTVLPLDLIAVYPPPGRIDPLAPPYLPCLLATLAVSVGLLVLRRRWPGLLAGWITYVVVLAPNLGIIQYSEQIAADRYSYMAMLGPTVVLAGCLRGLWEKSSRARPLALGARALGVGLIAGLVLLTWAQCRTWRDSETLWAHALAHGAATSATAHYNLALVLVHQGKLEAAVAHGAAAIRLDPRDVAAYNIMGVALERQGKLDAAAARCSDALRLDPNNLNAHYNLGIIFSRQGNFRAAEDHYAHALRLNPGFAAAYHNLGVDCFRQGKLADAEAYYTEALRLDPARVDTHANLGVVLSHGGRFEEAEAHYVEALRLKPDYDEARRNLQIDRARRTKLEAESRGPPPAAGGAAPVDPGRRAGCA